MAKLQFHMYLSKKCIKNRGVMTTFIDGKGNASTSWWSGPPENIDTAHLIYLKGRFSNVKTERHAEFIREQYKEQMKQFEEYEPNRFRPVENPICVKEGHDWDYYTVSTGDWSYDIEQAGFCKRCKYDTHGEYYQTEADYQQP